MSNQSCFETVLEWFYIQFIPEDKPNKESYVLTNKESYVLPNKESYALSNKESYSSPRIYASYIIPTHETGQLLSFWI